MHKHLRLVAASAAARAALLAALMVLAACNGENRSYSPTEPQFPAAATPTPTPTPSGSANGNYSLGLVHHSGGVRSVEVLLLVDRVELYKGPLLTDYAWDVEQPLVGSLGKLSAGPHQLILKLIRQELSPDTYQVTAIVNVGLRQVGFWRESVTLETGNTWTGEFVVQ